jgi:16S rRNA C1402 (ribose-2'-O) methylase RsmI
LGPFLTDLAIAVPLRSLVLALDLTQPTEWWCEGTAVHVKTELEKRFGPRHKAEIVWMLEPGR